MTKYIFCILACAFLVLGFSNVSNKELQGFQKKLKPRLMTCDMKQCHAVAFLLPASTSQVKILIRSLLTRHPLVMLVTAFLTISLFRRSIVPFKNLKFNTNTVIIQILSSLNVMLPENRLGHTGLDVNYTKYSCKYYVYTLAHILI